MINPPQGPLEGPISAGETPTTFPNVVPSEEDQKAIVAVCNSLKSNLKQHALEKKRIMRDSYAYSKSKFIGNDLLPLPSTDGNDRDINSQRPQVFIPKTRQLVKTLYSHIKLTLFPNDEDFFRVRAKTGDLVVVEDELTDGLKYIFKQAMIPEKIGDFLLNIVSMSNGACFPTVKDDLIVEWQFDPVIQQYKAVEIDTPPMPDLEVFDPLNFYVDPGAKDPDKQKWGYFYKKKKQELKDSKLYFNTDERLDKLAKKTVTEDKDNEIRTTEYTDLNSQFDDVEDSVDYDLYYFPYMKTKTGQEYRNMLVGVAGGELLVRFHPNMTPRGANPATFCTWMDDPHSPYGIGPVEDVMEIQRLINIIYNYCIETLARIGNQFAVSEDVDVSQAWGVAARIFTCSDPQRDVQAITGNYAEPAALMNFAGTMAAELQQTGGAQNPFQGSSNIDFKKTATELQILQENSISIVREVIEHIGVAVKRILEGLMYLAADLYKEPVEVRIDHPVLGPQFKMVDFSILKTGKFCIELVSINPSQSKQAQVETLMQLLELVVANPQGLANAEPLVRKIGELQGMKDTAQLVDELKQGMMYAQGVPGVPGPQAGMGAIPQPPMEQLPPPPPPEV